MMISIIFAFSIFLRWLVSLHSYSGHNNPPIFGDYEAQRHWQEVTVNLPVTEWYRNGTDNDLLYWGLDYPPLTAYHSYLIGKIAGYINPKWVELYTSRGFESYEHKIFMRSTVLVTDILIFMSALYYLWYQRNADPMKLFRNLIVPSVLLIDYGHFQYNTVSLGLFLWACFFFERNRYLLAALFYCLSLNYKQMSLYYSLPIFFYILKHCFDQKTIAAKFFKLLSVGGLVLVTFAILWFPYLKNAESALQVVRRIFPLERGIYEDKVANFWYCISVVIKIKNLIPSSWLTILSTCLTLLGSLPSCYMVFRKNTLLMLKYSLVTVSMSFFLFSFQVHEKSILFVNVPLLLLSGQHPLLTIWFSIISTFSLQPLLIKDGLMIPYFALVGIYLIICGSILKDSSQINKTVFCLSLFGCLCLSVSSLVLSPPTRFPHLHVLLNCVWSFLHFFYFFVYLNYQQFVLFNNEKVKDKKRL